MQFGRNRDRVFFAEIDLVCWIESVQLVEIGWFSIEIGKKLFEDIGHPIPGGAHVEDEAIFFELARSSPHLLVLLKYSDLMTCLGQVTCGRKRGKPRAQNDYLLLQCLTINYNR